MIKVTAAVIEKNGLYLIVRKNAADENKKRWEFPGGKIEAGESPEECLKRELKEELRIDADIGGYIGSGFNNTINNKIELLAFQVINYFGDIEMVEHDKMYWTDLNDLDNYNMEESDRQIVEMLKS